MAADEGLVIVDSGATEQLDHRQHYSQSNHQWREPCQKPKVEIAVEAGRAMSFKLADGTTTNAKPTDNDWKEP